MTASAGTLEISQELLAEMGTSGPTSAVRCRFGFPPADLRQNNCELIATVFARMSASTGGEAFFAKTWRAIKVKLVGDRYKKYRIIRTGSGYSPKSSHVAADTTPAP